MSKTKIFIAFICILVFTISACDTFSPTEEILPPTVIAEPTIPPQKSSIPLREADVPRVDVEIAKAAVDTGAAIIVDVRSKQAYDESHIPGAINILLGEFETNINGIALDKDQWIITYCT